jgi:methionyl-tRNA synthetase
VSKVIYTIIHFIGKDNIVFHCIIFPAMLMEHGEFVLPDNVPANEFLNLEGDKISTSRNWAVWLHEYLNDFKDMQDVLRYTLCTNMPETKDNDFTWKDFQAKNNNELVAILGNFINRTLVLTHKYFEGKVPVMNVLHEMDEHCLSEMLEAPKRMSESIEKFRFREALAEFINLARTGNKYLADTEPWKLHGKDNERVATIMHISLQLTACLAVLSEPFLPFSASKIYKMLNLEHKDWTQLSNQLLPVGHTIAEPSLLYNKIEDAVIEQQIEKLHQSKQMNKVNEAVQESVTVPAQKAETSFDEFSKMDIRTGTIIEAERVPKTDKLLKLKISTGIDERTIVSGIAQYYEPSQIIGQRICMLVNLAPRKIKGIESQGMILMAENSKGELCFVTPTKDFNDGSTVK